ncbi:MAG: hypothetical protein QE272_10130 [Nevskia sp.]|nr:hypothetical protein [Nevskia sp.]
MNLSRVVVIVAVTAAIVYTGLNFMLPRSEKTPAAETAATTEAAATGEAPAAAEPAAEAAALPAEAPAEDGAAAATAEDPALTEAEARQIAANVASEVAARVASEGAAPTTADTDSTVAEPAVEAPAAEAPVAEAAPAAETATADAGGSELTDEQKRRIAANVARESTGASEPVVEAAAAPEPEAVPAPKPEPKAEPKPASKPTPKAAQVAAAEPSSAPAPKAPKAAKPAAAPTRTIGNGQDVISAWWKKQPSSDRLNLVYAGEASSEKAVVLMFDSAVDSAAAGSQIKLVNAKGDVQSGSWSSGSNPRLIAFKGVPTGRYTVIVAAAMADTSGKTVGSELVGPVYVH